MEDEKINSEYGKFLSIVVQMQQPEQINRKRVLKAKSFNDRIKHDFTALFSVRNQKIL